MTVFDNVCDTMTAGLTSLLLTSLSVVRVGLSAGGGVQALSTRRRCAFYSPAAVADVLPHQAPPPAQVAAVLLCCP
jgi:hypothetical protein